MSFGLKERVQQITGVAFSLQPSRSLASFLIMDVECGLDRRSTAVVDRAIQPFGLIDLGVLKSAVKPESYSKLDKLIESYFFI